METQEVKTEQDKPIVDKIVKPTEDWMDTNALEARVRLAMRKEYEDLFKYWKTTELVELDKKNEAIIDEGLQKYFEQQRDQLKPPTHDEIQELLSQEYETFPVKVNYAPKSGDRKDKLFTLRELPQEIEEKFYNQFKKTILAKSQELAAFAQEGMDKSFEEQARSFLELFGESFGMIAEAVTLCLNPYNEDEEVDVKWVQRNISSNRQWSIIEAQMKVNRLKDFFLRVSQSGQQTQTMMTGQRFQQLRQLVR